MLKNDTRECFTIAYWIFNTYMFNLHFTYGNLPFIYLTYTTYVKNIKHDVLLSCFVHLF